MFLSFTLDLIRELRWKTSPKILSRRWVKRCKRSSYPTRKKPLLLRNTISVCRDKKGRDKLESFPLNLVFKSRPKLPRDPILFPLSANNIKRASLVQKIHKMVHPRRKNASVREKIPNPNIPTPTLLQPAIQLHDFILINLNPPLSFPFIIFNAIAAIRKPEYLRPLKISRILRQDNS